MQILIPRYVQKIIDTIEKNNGEAYIVGGCVRDMLLFKTPDDFDVATSLLPEEIIPLFEKTIPTGLKHGTVTVLSENIPVEVTTYRTDGTYSDSRHPEDVSFVKNLREDLARRDFTVNALAYNKNTSIVDEFGGISDLNSKTLRAVGDPYKRFNEDALRILRLFRFSAQHGFDIEKNTYTAALDSIKLLENISRERIATELYKALLSDYPENINPLLKSGAFEFLNIYVKEIAENFKTLPKDRNLRFFAFLKGVNTNFDEVCRNLKTDKKLLSFCMEAKELIKNPPFDLISCKKTLSRFSTEATFTAMLLSGKDTTLIEKVVKSSEPFKVKDLAVNGNDLKDLGIENQKIGEILEKLLDKVIENPNLNTKEKLLEISRNQ